MEKLEPEPGTQKERMPNRGDIVNLRIEASTAATGANIHEVDNNLAALEGVMNLVDEYGWTDQYLALYKEAETNLRKVINQARIAKA